MQETDRTELKQSLRRRGICVVIPTYNNAGTITDVVTRALEHCGDVFVVCDGCSDSTTELLEAMPVGPRIISYPDNRGKGTALKLGFMAALDAGFAYAITLDADAQHYPEDIPLFLEANRKWPGAIIVGERKGLENAERSKASSFANSFSNFWFTIQTGLRLSDTQTGYRLYPLKKLRSMSLLTSRYEAELELLVFAAWRGVPIKGIEVNVYYPPKDERVSHFRPVRDFARISVLNTVLCVLALVYGLPRFILRCILAGARSVFAFVYFAFFTAFVITPAVFLYLTIGGKSARKKERVHDMICTSARITLHKIKVPGMRYSQANPFAEDFSRPCVIICNHQSHIDLLPLLALTPKLVVLTADWVWSNPFYGFVIRNADYLPASRGMDAILPQLRELVAHGYSVAVYPEGTRSLDCSIGRFHQGAFLLARELGIDILPIILYGAGRLLPKHGRYLRRSPVRLEIDRRISPAELASGCPTLKEQVSKMRRYYQERYSEIADRLEQEER